MDDDERALILKAQKGDQRAFECLVSRYDRRVLGLACDMVGHPEDAQDVFQETFLAAYRALPGFRMDSDFFTWLYRIAVNKALTFRRSRVRRIAASADGNPADPSLRAENGAATPEELVLQAELRRQIESALEGLSAQERMAFVLCHKQGFKIRQTALFMSCSEGAVKSYLFRAREKMKSVLCKYTEI
ncbi:sigma-70 family RNA polymerase sigma factor [bacterium]|nr:sigma-70 family RNA polymerase sigma factor [bacterium]